MDSCFKLLLFYLFIITCLYVIYQVFNIEMTEKKNNNPKRISYFKFQLIIGIFILIFLNYNFLFNQKIK
jgi:hypothetical protein